MAASDLLIVAIALVSLLIILVIVFIFQRRVERLVIFIEQEKVRGVKQAQELAEKLFNQWSQSSVNTIRNQITDTLKKEYEVRLETWKKQEEEKIRKDAIQKSINTLLGKIGEEFSPVLLSSRLGVNLKDFRHLGTPVDFVTFKGLSDDVEDIEIVFLEIKSGKSSGLIEREKRVRDAVSKKNVRYEVVNLREIVGEVRDKLEI
jgi:predicted Holliday junction resolvase-like endonuclease